LQKQHDAQSSSSESLSIGFGSCYGLRDNKSDIFKTIAKEDLDLWIWLGDVAYADKVGSDKIMPKSYV